MAGGNGGQPNFKVFDRRSVPVTRTPLITHQARGNFSMNRAAFEDLGSPSHVETMYDPKLKIIGFRAVDPSTPHAYPVKESQGRGSSYYVAGKAFSDFHGIETGVARRFVAHEYPGGVLGIDLNEKPLESNVTRRRGAKNAADA